MCGRFAQAQTREEYLAYLAEEAEYDIPWDPAPIGRYNVCLLYTSMADVHHQGRIFLTVLQYPSALRIGIPVAKARTVS